MIPENRRKPEGNGRPGGLNSPAIARQQKEENRFTPLLNEIRIGQRGRKSR